jgi:hypothetical protein
MKVITFLLVIGFSLSSFAQKNDTNPVPVNKKGVPILPVKGDWAIGISATPFLEYIGNMFANDYHLAPYFSSLNPGSIYAKFQNRDDMAIRASISVGFTNRTNNMGNASDPETYDKEKISALSVGLSMGLEKYRRILSRIRGYYGFDAGLYKSAYDGYRYQMAESTQGKFTYIDGVDSDNNFKETGGNTYALALEGIIGIEYFIAPKVCISGEFGIGARGELTQDRKYVPEIDDEIIFDPGNAGIQLFTNTNSLIGIFIYF